MAQRRGVIRKIDPVRSVSFDQRRWPVVVALVALTSVAAALVVAVSSFDDPRPLHNGWFRLAMLAVGVACLSTLVFLLDAQLSRRSQLALVLSAICHVLLSGVLCQQYLGLPVIRVADEAAPDPDEQPVVVAEYHVRPADRRPLAEAFERPEPVRSPDVPAVDQTRQEPQARPADAQQQLSTLPETEPALEPTPIELRRPLAAASHRAPEPSQMARQMAPATAPWSADTPAPDPREETGEPVVEVLSPRTSPTPRRDATVQAPKAAADERQLATSRDAVAPLQTARLARRDQPADVAARPTAQAIPLARSATSAAAVIAGDVSEATIPLANSSRRPAPRPAAASVPRAGPTASQTEPDLAAMAAVAAATPVPLAKTPRRQVDAPRSGVDPVQRLARQAQPAPPASHVAATAIALSGPPTQRQGPQPADSSTARQVAPGRQRPNDASEPLAADRSVPIRPNGRPGGRPEAIRLAGARQPPAAGMTLKRAAISAAGVAGQVQPAAATGLPTAAAVIAEPAAAGGPASPAATPTGIATAARRATQATLSTGGHRTAIDLPAMLTVRGPSQRRDASAGVAAGGGGTAAGREPSLRKARSAVAAAVAGTEANEVPAATGVTDSAAASGSPGAHRGAAPAAQSAAAARQSPTGRERSGRFEGGPLEMATDVALQPPASQGTSRAGGTTSLAAASVPRQVAAAGQVAGPRSDDVAGPPRSSPRSADDRVSGPVVSDSDAAPLARASAPSISPPKALPGRGSSLAAAGGSGSESLPPIGPLARRRAGTGTRSKGQRVAGTAGSPHRKAALASLPGQVVTSVPGMVSLSEYAQASSPAVETAVGRQGRVRGTLRVPAAAAVGAGGLARMPSPQAGLPHRKALRESEIVHYRPDKYPQRKFGGPAVASGRARDVAAAFVRRGERQRKINEGGNGRPLAKTEAAIELGLAFLARQQLPDGRWSFRSAAPAGRGSAATPRGGALQADTAATGLSLLAFLGAGYDHYDDQYQQVVRRGLNYLVDHQQPSGALYRDHRRESDRVAQMYSHGIATIALCEAVGMTGDPALRPAAQRAIDFIVAAQHPQRGGWRYQPRRSSDLSVTGWQLMSLKSGELAGMRVPPAAYRNVVEFLDRCRGNGAQRSLYLYNPYAPDTPQQRHGRQPSTVMTAIGLLMRLYTGRDRTDPDIQRGAAHLLANLPRIATPAATGSLGNPMRDTYYWYHATQVMFHMRGRYWNAWHNALHSALIDTQIKTGSRAGSWDSRRPVPDRWGPQGGDLLMTAMNLLSLEVTYRHLPIYENTLDRPSTLATAGK